jgi:hypothetical protein
MTLVPIDPARMIVRKEREPYYEVCVGDSYGGGRIVLALSYKKITTNVFLTIDEAECIRDLFNKALRFQYRRNKRLAKIQQASNTS